MNDRARDGTEFDACPGWWRRSAPLWDHAREWTVRGRIVYVHAVEAAEGLAHAWPHVLPDDLPGPLYDGVVAVWHEQRQAHERRMDEIKADSKRRHTPGMESF